MPVARYAASDLVAPGGMMGKDELPDNQQDRVSWVIGAPDNQELRRRYDIWAHQCDFSKPTKLPGGSFDGLVTCGTTSQVPCASLREYARLVRPGGRIIFAAATDAWVDCGYADVFAELSDAGTLSLVSRGDAFQMMPTTEPQFYCEVLVIEKH